MKSISIDVWGGRLEKKRVEGNAGETLRFA